MILSNRIRVVLVEPQHPGNIGQAARAMKTMGLSRLYLVNPARFPDREAFYRASRADDVVKNAVITKNLSEAVLDCGVLLGTSGRDRIMSQTKINPREAADKIVHDFKREEVALIFGCEKCGLNNEMMQQCHFQITIPSVEEYSSLNLAAAVQVIAYEIRMASLASTRKDSPKSLLATQQDLNGFYQHLRETMVLIQFLDIRHPRKMMERFRQIYNRALLDKEDINLLRGMLTATENKTGALKKHV